MTPIFRILTSKDNKFYFVLEAENSETILTSETYDTKASAYVGIASVKVNSQIDERYQRYKATNGERYFVLKSYNNIETIGVSEMYTSPAARDNGILSVKSNAPKADTVEGGVPKKAVLW